MIFFFKRKNDIVRGQNVYKIAKINKYIYVYIFFK